MTRTLDQYSTFLNRMKLSVTWKIFLNLSCIFCWSSFSSPGFLLVAWFVSTWSLRAHTLMTMCLWVRLVFSPILLPFIWFNPTMHTLQVETHYRSQKFSRQFFYVQCKRERQRRPLILALVVALPSSLTRATIYLLFDRLINILCVLRGGKTKNWILVEEKYTNTWGGNLQKAANFTFDKVEMSLSLFQPYPVHAVWAVTPGLCNYISITPEHSFIQVHSRLLWFQCK